MNRLQISTLPERRRASHYILTASNTALAAGVTNPLGFLPVSRDERRVIKTMDCLTVLSKDYPIRGWICAHPHRLLELEL